MEARIRVVVQFGLSIRVWLPSASLYLSVFLNLTSKYGADYLKHYWFRPSLGHIVSCFTLQCARKGKGDIEPLIRDWIVMLKVSTNRSITHDSESVLSTGGEWWSPIPGLGWLWFRCSIILPICLSRICQAVEHQNPSQPKSVTWLPESSCILPLPGSSEKEHTHHTVLNDLTNIWDMSKCLSEHFSEHLVFWNTSMHSVAQPFQDRTKRCDSECLILFCWIRIHPPPPLIRYE